MASIDTVEASITDQHSRQSFIDDTLGDATSDQKSRPERSGEPRTPKPVTGGAHIKPVCACVRPYYACPTALRACARPLS